MARQQSPWISQPLARPCRVVSMRRLAQALFLVPWIASAQECAQTLERAQTAFNTRQFVIAKAELESALARCPQDSLRVRIALGQTQYLLGKEAEAEQSLAA